MNFTCSGNITGVMVGADIRWRPRNWYPEIQIWRNVMGTDQFVRQASEEIRLNPGDFSPDGVLQYKLFTPNSYQSGDVLGVYQPSFIVSTARLYYTTSSNTLDSYRHFTFRNSLTTIDLKYISRRSSQLLLTSLITGTKYALSHIIKFT